MGQTGSTGNRRQLRYKNATYELTFFTVFSLASFARTLRENFKSVDEKLPKLTSRSRCHDATVAVFRRQALFNGAAILSEKASCKSLGHLKPVTPQNLGGGAEAANFSKPDVSVKGGGGGGDGRQRKGRMPETYYSHYYVLEIHGS
jgi:hypothetical protein